jgi:hypothetical protein
MEEATKERLDLMSEIAKRAESEATDDDAD